MSGKSNGLLRRKQRSETSLSPQVRKLDSGTKLPPTLARKKVGRTNLHSTARQSSNSLHLGKAACTVPEHDDLFKRNEKLKEALKKEKEQTKLIRDEFEERESLILRENSQLKEERAAFLAEKAEMAQRHEQALHMIAEKHREHHAQIEKQHQTELKLAYKKSEEALAERNKVIETLKFQIAQLMKGQSTERQAQIAELRKKLVNAAQEANELRSEIMKLNSSRNQGSEPGRPAETGPHLRIALCMNCIVMQQALTMANAALKAKMKELDHIQRNASNIKIGLTLNDIALEALERSQKED